VVVFGQHFDKAAHVGAFEFPWQINGEGKGAYCLLCAQISFPNVERVFDVANADPVNGDIAPVIRVLNVSQGFVQILHGRLRPPSRNQGLRYLFGKRSPGFSGLVVEEEEVAP
jgi:hypothetical protein